MALVCVHSDVTSSNSCVCAPSVVACVMTESVPDHLAAARQVQSGLGAWEPPDAPSRTVASTTASGGKRTDSSPGCPPFAHVGSFAGGSFRAPWQGAEIYCGAHPVGPRDLARLGPGPPGGGRPGQRGPFAGPSTTCTPRRALPGRCPRPRGHLRLPVPSQVPDQRAHRAGRALQRHLAAGEPPLRRGLPDPRPARVRHLRQCAARGVQADQTGARGGRQVGGSQTGECGSQVCAAVRQVCGAVRQVCGERACWTRSEAVGAAVCTATRDPPLQWPRRPETPGHVAACQGGWRTGLLPPSCKAR